MQSKISIYSLLFFVFVFYSTTYSQGGGPPPPGLPDPDPVLTINRPSSAFLIAGVILGFLFIKSRKNL